MTTVKKPRKKKAPRVIYLVVQEGGSSLEWYPSLYDTRAHAESAIRGHMKATYDAIGPFELGENLTKVLLTDPGAESQLVELVDELVTVAIEFTRH